MCGAKLYIKNSKFQIFAKIIGGQFCFFTIDIQPFKIKKVDNLKFNTFPLVFLPFLGQYSLTVLQKSDTLCNYFRPNVCLKFSGAKLGINIASFQISERITGGQDFQGQKNPPEKACFSGG